LKRVPALDILISLRRRVIAGELAKCGWPTRWSPHKRAKPSIWDQPIGCGELSAYLCCDLVVMAGDEDEAICGLLNETGSWCNALGT